MAAIQNINSLAELTKVLANPKCIILFYSVWCPACHMILMPYEQFSQQYVDICFARIDSEKMSQIAEKYNVSVTPTFVLFKNGMAYKNINGSFYNELLTSVDDLNSFSI